MIAQLVPCLLVMGKIGWIRLDWDGRGHPSELLWVNAGLTTASWAKSNQKPNKSDPALWPGYRGSKRNGIYTGPAVKQYGEAKERISFPEIWRTSVGSGHSSMTIARGRLFTVEQWKDGECITCYNLQDGRGLWSYQYNANFRDNFGNMGGAGPRSAPTWDEEKLYVAGAEGEFTCLDANNGKVIWSMNIFDKFGTRNLDFGMCASPLIIDEKVIITGGARAGKARDTVFAMNKLSGETIWKTEAEKQAYVSPMMVTLAGKKQILIGAGREFQGLSIETGKIIWSTKWSVSYDNNIAQPIVIDQNHVFVSSGYGKGCGLIEITENQGAYTAKLLWENKNLKNKFTSSVLYQDHIYGLDDSGSDNAAHLVCLKARTGETIWRGDNYGHGQLLLAQNQLVIQCENGDVAMVKATPESHQLLDRFPVLKGKTWNNPALAGGRLYVRNDQEMVCIDVSEQTNSNKSLVSSNRRLSPLPDVLTILLTGFLLTNGIGATCLGLISIRE